MISQIGLGPYSGRIEMCLLGKKPCQMERYKFLNPSNYAPTNNNQSIFKLYNIQNAIQYGIQQIYKPKKGAPVVVNFKTKFDWQLNVLFFHLENIWPNVQNPYLPPEIEFFLTEKAVSIFIYSCCQPLFH